MNEESTFTLEGCDVAVTLPPGLRKSHVLAFHPFNTWVNKLTASLALQAQNQNHPFHASPYTLNSIKILSYTFFGSEKLGFLYLSASISNKDGERLPGAIFLRGPSVAMLFILTPQDAQDEDERYAVLTVQPRIPAGSLSFTELPAGTVDEEGAFAGTAAKEIKEELGIEIKESELVCLSDLAAPSAPEKGQGDEDLSLAMYPSPGACDEYIKIYMCEKKVPRENLKEWTGKLTGLREHGEKITLKLVHMRDLWKEGARDSKCLSALVLWEALKREGSI